jgi:hypothetical protein
MSILIRIRERGPYFPQYVGGWHSYGYPYPYARPIIIERYPPPPIYYRVPETDAYDYAPPVGRPSAPPAAAPPPRQTSHQPPTPPPPPPSPQSSALTQVQPVKQTFTDLARGPADPNAVFTPANIENYLSTMGPQALQTVAERQKQGIMTPNQKAQLQEYQMVESQSIKRLQASDITEREKQIINLNRFGALHLLADSLYNPNGMNATVGGPQQTGARQPSSSPSQPGNAPAQTGSAGTGSGSGAAARNGQPAAPASEWPRVQENGDSKTLTFEDGTSHLVYHDEDTMVVRDKNFVVTGIRGPGGKLEPPVSKTRDGVVTTYKTADGYYVKDHYDDGNSFIGRDLNDLDKKTEKLTDGKTTRTTYGDQLAVDMNDKGEVTAMWKVPPTAENKLNFKKDTNELVIDHKKSVTYTTDNHFIFRIGPDGTKEVHQFLHIDQRKRFSPNGPGRIDMPTLGDAPASAPAKTSSADDDVASKKLKTQRLADGGYTVTDEKGIVYTYDKDNHLKGFDGTHRNDPAPGTQQQLSGKTKLSPSAAALVGALTAFNDELDMHNAILDYNPRGPAAPDPKATRTRVASAQPNGPN